VARKISVSDWVYLAASLAASYYLVQMERGQEQDIELRVYWFLLKVSRKLTNAAVQLEKRLNAEMNAALDRRPV
jgi:hypothetical protein